MCPVRQDALTAILDEVSQLLSREGCRSYIVGGCIRDWLLSRKINDIDIAVEGDAISIGQNVAQALGGRFVLLDELNCVARVVLAREGSHCYLDFSSFQGDIEADLARRDFTIDAMATPLNQPKTKPPQLIDPFCGKKDLEDRVIRAVSDQAFEADAVRMLRAIRLAAELDFTIEPETESLIRRYYQSITKVPGERVREELVRVLDLPRAAYHLRYLDNLGLLSALVPELAECKGVEQPTIHFWDVFDHSLQTVAAIEFLIRQNDWEYGGKDILITVPWSDLIDEHLSQEVSSGCNRKVLLKLGGLLHDVAKPGTKFVDEAGRAHFYGHTKEGADMAAAILQRLRFSNREISLVKTLVYHHLHPIQMANEGLPTKRAVYRYFRDTDECGIDILFLALADYLATYGPLINMADWRKQCQLVDHILTEHAEQQTKIQPVKLVTGHDLMDTFGLAPGPLIGELLALVQEAQASGEVANKQEALALVQNEILLRASNPPKARDS